ncbi:MAG: hypothetical protein RLZZ597_1259 [Cyanobacteriota bacterium]|jgi:hypothetical protein
MVRLANILIGSLLDDDPPETMSDLNFLIKVLALSAGLGIVIKYLLPSLSWGWLEPSLGLALALLIGPSVLMAVLLWAWTVAQRPQAGA